MVEILNAQQVADLMQMSKRQIYNLCRERVRSQQQFPIPLIRLNGNVRFIRSQVEDYLVKLSQEQAQ
jgi:predicted DNA-binding transcriptional regulator AlpA